ncbi:MAG: 1-acyl-sn-glycerol-3-phosphate acyltransferase [Parachlamydia sp.]|nr:1-acyl-sn-glycerol-3-phosphate acyltransferase [Parachlamydia sp.]
MTFLEKLNSLNASGNLPAVQANCLIDFYHSYAEAVTKNGHTIEEYEPILTLFLDLVQKQLKNPFHFEPYHERILSPFDYYHFALDMLRPLVIFESSKRLGLQNVARMESQLREGHNIILFANHQTEPDPQAISLLLEESYPKFAEEMIFVAGHRVISDPLAIPFSMGRNLLCIFSKKYIDAAPEKKPERIQHNQKTMKVMAHLLEEGGKCIYVAPSGGRDRPNKEGILEVAPFDPQSVEMFHLIAQQAKTPTHYYPLALATYAFLPPPNSIKKQIGEKRQAQCTPIHLAFGSEIDMEHFPDGLDKRQKRKIRSDAIWNEVKRLYLQL